jgi:superfamily II DNA or RNA helicase
MKLDPIRQARQEEIIDLWEAAGHVGTAECATGFGKTIMAILAIRRLREEQPITAMVVVPTLYLRDQWLERLKDFGIDDIEVWVINSAVKEHHFVDLLILDEIHQYTAEVFGQIFDRVGYAQVLGLTATLREDDPRTQIIYARAPIIATVTMKEALTHGWIAPFQVFNLAVTLTDAEMEQYTKLSKDFNRHFASFGHNFPLAMACVNDPNTLKAHAKKLQWDEKRVQAAAFSFLRNMRERKEMMYGLTSKHLLALQVIESFPDRMIITFSQTIESAEWLAAKVGSEAEVYHSQMKAKKVNGKQLTATAVKQAAVDRFTSDHHWNKCRVLCTAKAMDQGADIPDIDMAIIVSASATPLQAIQRYGRSLRAVEGKRTVIVELYAKDTQDERWLRARQKKVPKEVIRWVTDVEAIA